MEKVPGECSYYRPVRGPRTAGLSCLKKMHITKCSQNLIQGVYFMKNVFYKSFCTTLKGPLFLTLPKKSKIRPKHVVGTLKCFPKWYVTIM